MALLSPGAPELVASAASVRMVVPSVCAAIRTALRETRQGLLQPLADRPEPLRQRQGLALGPRRIVVGHDHAPGAEAGHVGERVADEHAGGEAAGARLDGLGLADEGAEQAGRRDQFVPAHQRRNGDRRRDGPHGAGQDAQEKPRGPLARLEEVHVGVGVIHRDGVGVLEHAVGQDAVQVEGDHDGDPLSEDLARLGQQESLGVVLVLGLHGAVEGEVDGVHGRRRPDGAQELAGDPVEVRRRQDPAGGNGAGAVGGNDLDVGLRREDAEGARHLAPDARVAAEHLGADGDAEVLVVTRGRIERGRLLLALGHQNLRHLRCSFPRAGLDAETTAAALWATSVRPGTARGAPMVGRSPSPEEQRVLVTS